MKKLLTFLTILLLVASVHSCDLIDAATGKLGGTPSAMGAVGVTVTTSSSPISGVSNFTATVTTSNDGVSTYSGSATVTNSALSTLFTNIPGVSVNGSTVSTTNMQFKQTTKGLELLSGPTAGIIVNYDSNVGDKYPVGKTGAYREVMTKSTGDDYSYGFYLIKVLKVEEIVGGVKSAAGISKITYWANHKYGLVGVQFNFGDGTFAKFPVYTTAQND
ncbi:MAG: hypothetical protein CVU10_04110 [Bacteroidetes bacterium HGW-Bacteroidetes-5]|jgi:hypothetical protein|nr:MAG: hypothetical protein CVU10_04110 [Bacteroidetes bacterium HGW-Bacteroidetes-5]